MVAGEVLVNGTRKSEHRWSVKKCRRHNSATTVPKTRRKYRQERGSASPATLSTGTLSYSLNFSLASKVLVIVGSYYLLLIDLYLVICFRHTHTHSSSLSHSPSLFISLSLSLSLIVFISATAALERKFHRDSLFCPDELDSLFSYFDTGSGPRSESPIWPSFRTAPPTPIRADWSIGSLRNELMTECWGSRWANWDPVWLVEAWGDQQLIKAIHWSHGGTVLGSRKPSAKGLYWSLLIEKWVSCML